MSIHSPRLALITVVAAAAISLSGCGATSTPGSPDAGGTPDMKPVDVMGEGLVIQSPDSPATLCLGPIMESYPLQCSGPEVIGWDWTQADGEETTEGVTMGTYVVWGEWNGTALVLESQLQLALYDPVPFEDPALVGEPGTTPEQDLLDIESSVADAFPVEVLSSGIEHGYLFVEVVFDDGAVQEWADEEYGPDVVMVRPALRIVE